MTPSRHCTLRLRALPLGSAALALGLVLLPLAPGRAAGIVLHETGSTLLYPLFQLWIGDYSGAAPGVTLVAAATGSGAGERDAIARQVEIGASDAYMSDEQAEQNPGIRNIPLAISAQSVNYNIPGLNSAGIKLDGPIRRDLCRPDHPVERAGDRRAEPGGRAAGSTDRPDPPRRSFGRHLHLHPVPRFLDPELGGQGRLRHQRRLAGGGGRTHCHRQ